MRPSPAGFVGVALLLTGCAGSPLMSAPPPPGTTRLMTCVPVPSLYTSLCSVDDMTPVGPSSQGQFTSPQDPSH